ncbi:hypothetical protein D3C76_1646170 [compost metagenome]
MLGQMTLRQNLLRVQHEVAQQTKFRSGELDIDAVTGHALAPFIQLQTGRLQGWLIGQATGATQQRLHTQHQLFRVKGFAQVVVGTGL